MRFEGNVTYIGIVKEFPKGWGVGFKLDTKEEFFNVFAKTKELVDVKINFNKGDYISGEYEQVNKYKVVQNFDTPERKEKPFEKADTIKPIDMIITKNIMEFEKLFQEAQSTKFFKFFEKDKGSLERILVHLSMKNRERYE